MAFFTDLKNTLHGAYLSAADKVIGTLTESKFLQEGVLTPDEYVIAGDLLVFKCPTWSWSAGTESTRVDYLPPDKQCLITRKVPCKQRFHDESSKPGQVVEDDWELTQDQAEGDDEVAEIGLDGNQKRVSDDSDDDGEAIDIDADAFDVDNNLIEDDPAAAKADENVERTRTYDISITYDKYYQTPKVWLFGYSENQQPLTAQEVFMDISEDHAKKTVTVDKHPNLGGSWAFIHPCKHSHVMKKFIDRMYESGKEPRVDQYLLLFLKFLGAVLPTINYDNTFEIGL